ncbi:hypothetical protein [Coxiella burnetii]|uniref:hypothetical protein n=1 Tax=Coxiella burnetii TaxID=777 RepID=UPI00039C0947|nr:hypothetical protein [Coxiella burnetii]
MSRQPTNSQQDIEPPNVASDRTVASTAAVEKKDWLPLELQNIVLAHLGHPPFLSHAPSWGSFLTGIAIQIGLEGIVRGKLDPETSALREEEPQINIHQTNIRVKFPADPDYSIFDKYLTQKEETEETKRTSQVSKDTMFGKPSWEIPPEASNPAPKPK